MRKFFPKTSKNDKNALIFFQKNERNIIVKIDTIAYKSAYFYFSPILFLPQRNGLLRNISSLKVFSIEQPLTKT